jgi:hypothetical protein
MARALGTARAMPKVPEERSAPRRAFVGAALAGLVALRVRPGERALAATAAPAPLNQAELRSLVAWYETLVPGARRAGVADFVTEQLRADPPFALLQLRYLNWPPPFVVFYRAGIAALNHAAHRPFETLARGDALALARRAVAEDVAGWPMTPPLKAWVTATRADAMDVVYGTPAEMAAQDMPMVQVPPPRW